LVVAGLALPAGATNLLINGGFENPVDNQPTDHTATGWTFTNPTVLRSDAYNNTPGGKYSIWEQVWQPGGGGVNQTVSSGFVSAAEEFNLSCSYYFQPNFASDTGTTVDLGLTWLDASNDTISQNFQYIASNSAPLSTWTRYSLSAIAPIGATQVRVSFDYSNPNGANAGGAQSAYVDDADLEFVERTGPSTWTNTASGDWNNGINWSLGHGPDGINTIADFAGAISSATTVYTDISVTVGELVFNNPNEYVIGGAGSLTLNESGLSAKVEVDQGMQKLDLPVTIASNTVLDVASGATLIVGNPLTIDTGMSLTQSGGGTVLYESIVTVGTGGNIAFGNASLAGGLSIPSGTKASIGGQDSVLTVDSLSNRGILDVEKFGW
jgi:hypothetical protein